MSPTATLPIPDSAVPADRATAGEHPASRPGSGSRDAFRYFLIALTAFLTLVDLFATQAILPTLARHYGVPPAAMGLAVNASTLGMAISGLAIAAIGARIDRRAGIVFCLAALAVPTLLLSVAPGLAAFAVLRVVQGLFMAASFTLMLAYLAEECSERATAAAFAAYVTGNVASNLFGRLMSAAVADHLGLAGNFVVFACLNLAGAALVATTMRRGRPFATMADPARPVWARWGAHLANPALAATFAVGFCILFGFIGTFTYVNFVLVRAPFALSPMTLGLVYFVFAPAMLTTPAAGALARVLGARTACAAGLLVAGAGLPLLLAQHLALVLAGMVLIAAGTFAAQAVATGFVGKAARADRAAASGLYLAAYFLGGLAGSAAVGSLFDRAGWTAGVAGIGAALALAVVLSLAMAVRPAPAAAS